MLRGRAEREPLIAAAAGCDRLVLLGDVIELRHGPPREALAVAEPVLRELGAALGGSVEVVIVPGNHDHRLLREWLGRRAADGTPVPLGLETAVDWREDEPLATLAGWLTPASTRVAYPGAWLRDDVYATHGHYADRETTVPILERIGAGLTRRVVGERDSAPASSEDYEAEMAPMYAWIDGSPKTEVCIAERGERSGAGVARPHRIAQAPPAEGCCEAGVQAAVLALNRAGIGPLRPDVSGHELRRAGLHAFETVLGRLGVPARHAIFGHTHRAGPLPGDDRSEWVAATGAAMLNTGCWVYERGLLGADPGRALTARGSRPSSRVKVRPSSSICSTRREADRVALDARTELKLKLAVGAVVVGEQLVAAWMIDAELSSR